ncbi:hypothetical protein [Pectobacterium carotovorum]|uniref:hypothetical protein n=1 Tax=Pectobacterium carotovorum TaxID=554 RepID=UPI001E3941CA|nr:hypothetical protein [Pectobacterium carotovorum]UFT92949.1 hypothetical protein LQF52_13880 [Pectobacterium carotovorum]
MSRIKDIQFIVDRNCIDDFNASMKDVELDVSKIEIFSRADFEKFITMAEDLAPKVKLAFLALKKLAQFNRCHISVEIRTANDTYIKTTIDSKSVDDSRILLSDVEEMLVRVTENERK